MQQFVVPQFIDVEDKIFGPVTTRQFLIMLVAGLIIFLAWRFGDIAMFILVLATVGGFSLILAFFKVNGQSFHYFMLNVFQTIKKPSLRMWKKDYPNDILHQLRKEGYREKVDAVEAPKRVARARIRDLSLVVNTGGFYQAEDDDIMNL